MAARNYVQGEVMWREVRWVEGCGRKVSVTSHSGVAGLLPMCGSC